MGTRMAACLAGGTDWTKQKTRAKAAAKDLAKGLIALYAERQRRPGFAFSPDSPWQEEFEESFDYAETNDQLRCIADIKKDMEKPVPMDRLLCGDVGYGKTEVALRAVMKCVLDGKQAAILVPTTVLAQQHFTTAVNRFPGLLLGPVGAAQLAQPRGGTALLIGGPAAADVLAHQVQGRGGDVEAVSSGIGDLDIVLLHPVHGHLPDGSEGRCRNMQRMLQGRDLPASLDFDGRAMPAPGEIRITVGALSAGAEYPQLNLAVLTEGQLTAATAGRRTTGRWAGPPSCTPGNAPGPPATRSERGAGASGPRPSPPPPGGIPPSP